MASAGEESEPVAAISLGNVKFEEPVVNDPPAAEFTNVPLGDSGKKKKKIPRRILHFSDGTLEEYSTDEEEEEDVPPPVDPKTLSWLPWFWYYMVHVAFGALGVADGCGERLAWFFGITSPKYQYAIDEFYRIKEEEEEEKKMRQREEEAALARETEEYQQAEEGKDRSAPDSGEPGAPTTQLSPRSASPVQLKPADLVSEMEVRF